MAPPSTRRSGFSRRAQMGLFLSYVLAVGGVLFAGLLLVIAKVDPTGFNALKGAALDVTSPVASGGSAVSRFIGGIGVGLGERISRYAVVRRSARHAYAADVGFGPAHRRLGQKSPTIPYD